MRYVNFPGFQQMGRSLSGRVVLYGTGRRARSLIQEYLLPGGRVSSLYAVSDSRKHKPFFLSDGSEIPVYQPEMLLKEREPVTVLLTQEASLMDAILRLKALHLPDSVSYCIAVREYLSAACCGSGSHERPPIMPGHQIRHRAADILERHFQTERIIRLEQTAFRGHQSLPDRPVCSLAKISSDGMLNMRAAVDQRNLHIRDRGAGQDTPVYFFLQVYQQISVLQLLPVPAQLPSHRFHSYIHTVGRK